jgi:Fe-S-cluster containining protein
MHSLRQLLYRGAGICVGLVRRDPATCRVSRRNHRGILHAVRPASGRRLQPDREAGRRLYFLGQASWLHGLSGQANPVPNLAVLARKCGKARGLGARPRGLSRLGAWPPLLPLRDPIFHCHESKMSGEDRSHDSGDSRDEPRYWGELRALYDQLDAEVSRLGPVCQLSGRCCRFQEYGHALFVSALEIEFLLGGAPEAPRPLDRGQTCPWQDARGQCTARGARPMGCRVYYCDPSYQAAASDLSERFIARLKHLADRHGLSWNYAPLHRHLHERRDQGLLDIELAASDLS